MYSSPKASLLSSTKQYMCIKDKQSPSENNNTEIKQLPATGRAVTAFDRLQNTMHLISILTLQ